MVEIDEGKLIKTHRKDTWEFKITDENDIKASVFIQFSDYKFDGVKYPFQGRYTRQQWKAFSLINEKIEGIEKHYEKEKPHAGV